MDSPPIADGVVVNKDGGAKRIPLSEIGRIGHFQLGELPNSVQPVLSHTRRFRLVEDLCATWREAAVLDASAPA